jgi:hypothetical protein
VAGNRLDDSPNEVNKAGFVIHSAVHMGRKDLHCVMHTHTVAGMAISALDCGLLPLNQSAMRWYNRIAYHDFEGIARNEDERGSTVSDLGPQIMILRNHVCSPPKNQCRRAFCFHFHLEGLPGPDDVAGVRTNTVCLPGLNTPLQFYGSGKRVFGERDWPALVSSEIPRSVLPRWARTPGQSSGWAAVL